MQTLKSFLAIIFSFMIFTSCIGQDKKIANHPAAQIEDVMKNPDNIIVDVRTGEEYKEGHVPNALNIDIYGEQFEDEIVKAIPDKTTPVYIYCKSGKRSMQASEKLVALGYTNITNVTGGIQEVPATLITNE